MQQVVSPAPESTAPETPSNKEAIKKVVIGAGAVLSLFAIGLVFYFVGRQTKSSEEEPISPTPTLFESLSPPPEPTLTPTPLLTPSPTLSPTQSPTLTPTPQIKTKTLSSEAALDGFRASNGGGNDSLDIRSGRNQYLVSRGFVSFDLSSLPDGVTITQATLRIYQTEVVGNPYSVAGKLKIDHLDYGNSLGNEDYAKAAFLSSFATVTSNSNIEWKDVVVTDQVKSDLDSGRTRSQFRTHFETEITGGGVTGDFAYFESADNSEGTGKTPQLVIKYY